MGAPRATVLVRSPKEWVDAERRSSDRGGFRLQRPKASVPKSSDVKGSKHTRANNTTTPLPTFRVARVAEAAALDHHQLWELHRDFHGGEGVALLGTDRWVGCPRLRREPARIGGMAHERLAISGGGGAEIS